MGRKSTHYVYVYICQCVYVYAVYLHGHMYMSISIDRPKHLPIPISGLDFSATVWTDAQPGGRAGALVLVRRVHLGVHVCKERAPGNR